MSSPATSTLAVVSAVLGLTATTVSAEDSALTVGVYGPYPLVGSATPEIGLTFERARTSFGLQFQSVEGGGDTFLFYNRTLGTVWEQGSTTVRAGGTLGVYDTFETGVILAPLVQVGTSVSARFEIFGEAAPFAVGTGDNTVFQLFGGAFGITYHP